MTLYVTIKEDVDLTGLQRPILEKLWLIARVFDSAGLECVVTSARRPAAFKKSLHADGLALDFRANHIGSRNLQLKILAEIIGVCGQDFDVILHGEGANIHFHVEYDPK